MIHILEEMTGPSRCLDQAASTIWTTREIALATRIDHATIITIDMTAVTLDQGTLTTGTGMAHIQEPTGTGIRRMGEMDEKDVTPGETLDIMAKGVMMILTGRESCTTSTTTTTNITRVIPTIRSTIGSG